MNHAKARKIEGARARGQGSGEGSAIAAPRLLRIGNADVSSALGFIRRGRAFHVVASRSDIEAGAAQAWGEVRPMHRLEGEFLASSALRYVSWMRGGAIVREGARQVTFLYDTHKSTVRIR